MVNESLELMKAMASLFRKKAAVMQALEGGMSKKGTNTHFNYKFVTASDIKQTVGQLLAEHGLSLQMSGVATEHAVSIVEKKDYETKQTVTKEVPILRVQFSISLCDVDTGAVEQSYWFGEAGATDDKAASKAATSALKYYLISNLLIADKEEDKRDTDRDRQRRSADPTPASRPSQPNTSAPAQTPPSAPVEAKSTPSNHISSKDPDKWPAVLSWAKEKFGYNEADVNAALSPVMANGVFEGPRVIVVGYLLAAAAKYKVSAINALAKKHKIGSESVAAALVIPAPEIPY